jgi:hypothetical protein
MGFDKLRQQEFPCLSFSRVDCRVKNPGSFPMRRPRQCPTTNIDAAPH